MKKIILNDPLMEEFCKTACNRLSCNILWFMRISNSSLNLFASEQSILTHYWDKDYFLVDPWIRSSTDLDLSSSMNVKFGTNCKYFHECGFLYDLYKIFNVEEFVSIEQKTKLGNKYCIRLFTKKNRFIFMNELLNFMPIVKYFVEKIVKHIDPKLQQHPAISLSSLGEFKNFSKGEMLC